MNINKLQVILSRCKAADETTLKDIDISTISKLQVDEYLTGSRVAVKVYLYSSGKTGNNKPYRYPGSMKYENYISFRDALKKEINNDDDFEEDLI